MARALIGNRYTLREFRGYSPAATLCWAEDTRGDTSNRLRSLFLRRGRRVWLKIPRSGGQEPVENDLLRHEARVLDGLPHLPGITPVREIGMHEGQVYSVLDAHGGVSLDSLFLRYWDKPLPNALVVPIMRGLLGVLQSIHEQGVIHRNVTPSSIVLWLAQKEASLGQVKVTLTNFDLAYREPAVQLPVVLRGGYVVGTCGYMAPEQFRGEVPAPQVDIYAAGVLFYRLVTGQTPCPGRTLREVVLRKNQQQPPNPCVLRPGLREEVGSLIQWMLQAKPLSRPASSSEVLRCLEGMGQPCFGDSPSVLFSRNGFTEAAAKEGRR